MNRICVFRDDYEKYSGNHLEASQRSSKLRLLHSCCCQLLPDLKSKELSSLLDLLCKLLRTAASREKRVKSEEQLAILQLLAVVMNRCPSKLSDKLSK